MRMRFLVAMLFAAVLGGVTGAAVKDFHVTGFVIGDQGLATSLGGVDTNYVNINSMNGAVRWQTGYVLSSDLDPTQPQPPLPCGPCGPAYAPAGSLLLRQVGNMGQLWFKFGSNAADWQKIGG